MAHTDPSMNNGGEQANVSNPEQREPLLSTKLFVPPLRPNRVARPRLKKWMDSGLDKAITLVSAPAGYGKTTLVSAWLREIGLPYAWFSLDEGDNDSVRFLQYFLSALQQVLPALQMDLLGGRQGMSPSAFEHLLNILINEIAGHATPFVIVLDDFHLIRDQLVLDTIAYLIEHEPPQMHLVLISRTDPPIPLSHQRAQGQLVEIRADHLRFTQEEIADFLNKVAGLDLTTEEIAAMEARTEGWIAGLQLAAVSLQGIDDTHRFITAFTGSHYYIMDYLTEEVLKRQPARLRLFLLQSSILGRMCAALCEAVVDAEAVEQTSAQATLEALEGMNLFLIPLDQERRWYRYHHLFAEVLNRYLERQYPHSPVELNRRAAQWYEQNQGIPEAIQHSLAAGDRDHATRLIEQYGVLLLIRGEVTTLLKWIEAVEPFSRSRPWLYIFKAWAFALSGNLESVDGMFQAAEELISDLELTPEVQTMKGSIAAGRAYQANLLGQAPVAARFARQALDCLPDIDLVSRSLRVVATSLLGDASSMTGNLEEARQAYLESARFGQAAGDVHLTIVVNSNLANVLVEQGKLSQAARIYSETLHLATRPDGQKAVIAGRLYVELSQVYYEWNRLAEATDYAHQSLLLCKRWGNMDLQAVGHVMLARLEQVRGRPQKAQEAMQAAEQIARNYDLAPKQAMWVKCQLCRLWISQGNLERAYDILKECGVDAAGTTLASSALDGGIPYLYEPGYLVFLRLLLEKGEYRRARVLSERLFQAAGTTKRAGRMIEVLILQALAFQGEKDMPHAMQALERALSLAGPEGYMRVFLDEGAPMTRLLFLVKSHRAGQGYAQVLLSALGEARGPVAGPAQLLIEPLTGRELEVLRLIEAGCKNQDIADRLVVSIPTVKRHISNIYTKLGAKNRTQAVSLARELKLFE